MTARSGSASGQGKPASNVNRPSTGQGSLVAFLEYETGNEVPGTRQTLELTDTDQTWWMDLPTRDDGELRSFWVDLRSAPTLAEAERYAIYTVRFYGAGVYDDDLPSVCRAPSPRPPPAPPSSPPADDTTLLLGVVLGLGLPLLAVVCCLAFLVKREKKGQPVFYSLSAAPDPRPSNTEMAAAKSGRAPSAGRAPGAAPRQTQAAQP